MSSIKFELDAELRQDIGKGASRRLRHANRVPAVVYGAEQAPVSLTLSHDKVSVALAHEAFYSHILTLKHGKTTEKVILKALQRHPSRARIQHIDFLRVNPNQKLRMNIPLHFMGEEEAPGAKEGGIFQHLMSDIEVSCLPSDLPEFIEVDVSNLALNESIHLSQLVLPKNVELTALSHGAEEHDQAVISIHIPRTMDEISEEDVLANEAETTPATTETSTSEEGKKE